MTVDARLLDKARRIRRHTGLAGVARWALDRTLAKGASLDFVHVLSLEPADVRRPEIDGVVETRLLSVEEIRRFAREPANDLPASFVARAERGLDLCFGALHGDRLANYGWYALRSVEAEHAAGTALELPDDAAYMYKAFTHPGFRGRQLHGACMAAALTFLGSRGVHRLLSFVHWGNEASLRASDRLGFRRLGLLVVGPRGPIRVPRAALDVGVVFGDAAEEALAVRGARS